MTTSSTPFNTRWWSTTWGRIPTDGLVLGPDRAANLLEIVVLIAAEGDEVIIHAIPLRAVYRKLLDP